MAKTLTGFAVICPYCHDTEASVSIALNDLAELRCSGCDATFSPEEARDLAAAALAKWEMICRWVETARQALDSKRD